MKEIERCLKPGGIVIYVDFDTTLVRQDQVTYTTPAIRHQDGTVEGSWLQRMLSGEPFKPFLFRLLTIRSVACCRRKERKRSGPGCKAH